MIKSVVLTPIDSIVVKEAVDLSSTIYYVVEGPHVLSMLWDGTYGFVCMVLSKSRKLEITHKSLDPQTSIKLALSAGRKVFAADTHQEMIKKCYGED